MQRILFIFGTRPEAIKLCPLALRLKAQPELFDVKILVTAQHREMLDQVLATFSVAADFDLDLMQHGQSLPALTARILAATEPVLKDGRPDLVVVQGDTTTTFAGALAAFYQHIPVAHVEAGLRTGDMRQPYPEEMNRVLTSHLAAFHFAPTARASQALLREGIAAGRIFVTGNTGIDAVLFVRDALDQGRLVAPLWPWLDPQRSLILVTSHRRESFGPAFDRSMRALRRTGAAGPTCRLSIRCIRTRTFRESRVQCSVRCPTSTLLDPLAYVPFVDLMRRSKLIITDSGGVQEEAPSLGKPVLVLREKTERPEAVEAGTVKLVGNDEDLIVREAERLLDDSAEYARMTRIHNPYGDGLACERIAGILSGAAAHTTVGLA